MARDTYYFCGTTEKDAMSYVPGEQIVLHLQLMHEGEPCGCPIIRWKAVGEDGNVAWDKIDGTSGKFDIRTSMNCPGHLYVRATACDENGKRLPKETYTPFSGGAFVNWQDIRPAGREPVDYDAFWERVIRNELDPVKPEIIEQAEVESLIPGYRLFHVTVAAPGPFPVCAWLSVPADPTVKLPLHVGLQAGSVASYPKPTSRDLIMLCVNNTGIDNRKSPSYFEDMEEGGLYNYGSINAQNQSPDTCYWKYMILRDIQACRFALTIPQWDGKTFRLGGGSYGGFQAVNVAARFHRITDLLLGYPWMCDAQGAYYGRMKGAIPDLTPTLPYYDAAVAASRVSPDCRVDLIAGIGDTSCPPTGVLAMFNQLPCPKKLHMNQNGEHGHTCPGEPTYDYAVGVEPDGESDAGKLPNVKIEVH